jgi:hypothetical protein
MKQELLLSFVNEETEPHVELTYPKHGNSFPQRFVSLRTHESRFQDLKKIGHSYMSWFGSQETLPLLLEVDLFVYQEIFIPCHLCAREHASCCLSTDRALRGFPRQEWLHRYSAWKLEDEKALLTGPIHVSVLRVGTKRTCTQVSLAQVWRPETARQFQKSKSQFLKDFVSLLSLSKQKDYEQVMIYLEVSSNIPSTTVCKVGLGWCGGRSVSGRESR